MLLADYLRHSRRRSHVRQILQRYTLIVERNHGLRIRILLLLRLLHVLAKARLGRIVLIFVSIDALDVEAVHGSRQLLARASSQTSLKFVLLRTQVLLHQVDRLLLLFLHGFEFDLLFELRRLVLLFAFFGGLEHGAMIE